MEDSEKHSSQCLDLLTVCLLTCLMCLLTVFMAGKPRDEQTTFEQGCQGLGHPGKP